MIKIVQIDDNYLYPIFKNGRSSINNHATKHKCKWLFNEQANRAPFIVVFLREPLQRIISGVHTFIEFEQRKDSNIDYDSMLYNIQHRGITNEHFKLQIDWIKDLAEYYNGYVKLLDLSSLDYYVPIRKRPDVSDITEEQRNKIKSIPFKRIEQDYELYNNFLYKTIEIKTLLTRINIY